MPRHQCASLCSSAVLALLLIPGCFFGDAEHESESVSVPGSTYAGYWSGTLDGREVSFHVDESGWVDSVLAWVDMDLGSSTCTGLLAAVAPAEIVNSKFTIELEYLAGDPHTTLTGSFDGEDSVSGILSPYSASSFFVACGSSLVLGSSSGSRTIIDGASWSAAPATGSCDYSADGVCDESAGSGVCLEGTDPQDCG